MKSIKNIEIKKFGRFKDFKDDEIIFKRFNVLYGWNYSGKTTISKIFCLFDNNHKLDELKKDYSDMNFKLVHNDGSITTSELVNEIKVKVFNSDYTKHNLRFDECLPVPILMLGEENITKQKELKVLKDNLEKTKKVISNIESAVKQKTKYLDDEHSRQAKVIKDMLELSEPFTKTQFDQYIRDSDINELLKHAEIEDTLIYSFVREYKTTDNTKIITAINEIKPYNIAHIQEKLHQTITPSKTLEELINNPELEKWVYEGKKLHETVEKCKFCGQMLPNDLMQNLNEHFNKEFEDFKNEIEKLIEVVKPINLEIPHQSEFSEKYQEKYIELKGSFDELKKQNKLTCEKAVILINEKTRNFLNPMSFDLDFKVEDLNNVIKHINNLIDEHNLNKQNIQKHKQELKDKVIKYYIAVTLMDKKYCIFQKQIKKFNLWLNNGFKQKKENLVQEIMEIESEISQFNKGANEVNKKLDFLFGQENKIKIEVIDDKTFLYRDKEVAKNLSEGEKTAIAISHFLTNLDKLDTKELKETIVFVDDPISSLDVNNIYAVYGLITKYQTKVKQLFMSTHNYDFYKLFCSDKKDEDNNYKRFIVQRSNDTSIIKNMPKTLELFTNEYSFLYCKLYNFINSSQSDCEELFTITNMARRFMDTFLGFKIPKHMPIARKLNELKVSWELSCEIDAILNLLSHGESSPACNIGDKSMVEKSINQILKIVEEIDPKHVKQLNQIVQEYNSL